VRPQSCFSLHELVTSSAPEATRFYSALLGWRRRDTEPAEAGWPAWLGHDGRDVAPVRELRPAEAARGDGAHWLSYVAVASADRCATRAVELGGGVTLPARDVGGLGRAAVLRDPAGMPFAAWEARSPAAGAAGGGPGEPCWCELVARDARDVADFYRALFGWVGETQNMGPASYTRLSADREFVCAIVQPPSGDGGPGWGWLPHFAHADCDRAVERARTLGGSVVTAATTIASVGRFAVLRDPEGAAFAVTQTARDAPT
jgi:hypothetical protein